MSLTSRQSRIPNSTYRLQFNSQFKFQDAQKIIPYLAALGISDLYSSPCFQSSPESTHGYDVSDLNVLNPVLGTRKEYDAMIDELHRHSMGQILDFVPNHMGVAGSANLWWHDILENGTSSRYALYFDINWTPPQPHLYEKVMVPVLADMYGNILQQGLLQIEHSAGEFRLKYHDKTFPLDPATYPQILNHALTFLRKKPAVAALKKLSASFSRLPKLSIFDAKGQKRRADEVLSLKKKLEKVMSEKEIATAIQKSIASFNGRPHRPSSFDSLHLLLEAQNFRLAFWRSGSDELNYRRFFDIESLVALRMELPEVYRASHKLIAKLIESGAVTGLRIDHIDGLWDPEKYLQNLQTLHRPKKQKESIYVIVEKILCGRESLPESWLVHGTTGYEFSTAVTGLLVDSSAENQITRTYREFTGISDSIEDIIYRKKKRVLQRSLVNTVISLGTELHRLSQRNISWRDLSLRSLTRGIEEVIACFPVYRTYRKKGAPINALDRARVDFAVSEAWRRNPDWFPLPCQFIQQVITGDYPYSGAPKEDFQQAGEWMMKFQQVTGAVMAKGVEDTAFYTFNRLNALNEVGSSPAQFGFSSDEFHAFNQHQLKAWPHSMLATSTHDTKVSEDVRARLCALSELPELWREALHNWKKINEGGKTNVDGKLAPDSNEEYLFYEMLLGSWPLDESEVGSQYIERLQNYMRKAISEAKTNSYWTNPNKAWLEASDRFIARALDHSFTNHFLTSFRPLAEKVATLGMFNSLSQLILKLCSPGLPDIYQGNEVWQLNLVDPDNRRPVDYSYAKKILSELPRRSKEELLRNWKDGAIKLSITRDLLKLRNEWPELFRRGDYVPCIVEGTYQKQILAFERRWKKQKMVVIVPRLISKLGPAPLGPAWKQTRVKPSSDEPEKWKNLFTGIEVHPHHDHLELATLFSTWPFAVLTTVT